ncbi:MAG: glycosyltransferase, partial [Candidatus Methylacidiphilales bacterium]|nr:glycosyltransferase [Candidatus Methylacidiphilales bacterium]
MATSSDKPGSGSGSSSPHLPPQRSFAEKMERNITRLPRRTWDSLGRLGRSLWKLPHKILVRRYWMKLGDLAHYPPRKMVAETFPTAEVMAKSAARGCPMPADEDLPSIALVTPSFQQADYIRETLESVLWQRYPNLSYVVQDGGSNDGTREILEDYSPRLDSWASEKDKGQADAIRRGFGKAQGDIMAWLNSDDTLLPGSLHFVGRYFAT